MTTITTWNVNGFRAILKKDFKESIKKINPDILCLQEIKAKAEQVTQDEIAIEGYRHIWSSGERPGYSGVATYVKEDLGFDQYSTSLGREEFDREGRAIHLNIDDLTLFNIYFPNGQRGMDRVEYKLDFYSHLLDLCREIHARRGKIIITGDFNTAHNEMDLANPKENSKTSGFLPEERAWITKYLENGFKDAYRELYPEKVEYTWWTYRFTARERNVGWRLDYFLVSDLLLPAIDSVVVHGDIYGSDHCPVSIRIR